MSAITFAVLPVFLMLFVGSAMRHWRFLDDSFWPAAEKLTFLILIPALLIRSIADADLSDIAIAPMAAAVAGGILIVFALTEALRRMAGIAGPSYTSLVQGTIRFNVYIALPVIAGVYGPQGVATAAVPIAVIPPIVNILSIWTLARHGDAARPTIFGTLSTIARNPFIIGTLIGIALNATGTGLPPIIAQMTNILADASLLMGLLIAGAGLKLTLDRSRLSLALLTCVLRFVVMPVTTALLCHAFGVSGVAMATAVIFNSAPTAVASYVLARKMGGDADLMAAIITLQTGLGLVSIPVILLVLGGPG